MESSNVELIKSINVCSLKPEFVSFSFIKQFRKLAGTVLSTDSGQPQLICKMNGSTLLTGSKLSIETARFCKIDSVKELPYSSSVENENTCILTISYKLRSFISKWQPESFTVGSFLLKIFINDC